MDTRFQLLADLGVATVYEANARQGLLEAQWVSFGFSRSSAVAGLAYTVCCADGDNRALHEAVPHIGAGQVLVIAMHPTPRPVAVLGELMMTQLVYRKVAGVIVNAGVRDVASLRQAGVPVLARWVTPRGATKDHSGTINEAVRIGGTLVQPGDSVVLDLDGAVRVRSSDLVRVTDVARARQRNEAVKMERYRSGDLSARDHGFIT